MIRKELIEIRKNVKSIMRKMGKESFDFESLTSLCHSLNHAITVSEAESLYGVKIIRCNQIRGLGPDFALEFMNEGFEECDDPHFVDYGEAFKANEAVIATTYLMLSRLNEHQRAIFKKRIMEIPNTGQVVNLGFKRYFWPMRRMKEVVPKVKEILEECMDIGKKEKINKSKRS